MCNKMSDVRLSNASPTVERVDARQPDAPRPSARRNLFGRPDPEEIRRCLQATIEEDVRRVRDEYNFDPVRERPLSPRGAYEWEEDRDAPEFFSRQPHSQRPRGDQDPQDGQEAGDGPASRKRRSGDSGPCSSECQSKRPHTDRGDDDDDDDEDKSGGAASQAVKSTEESCAEVQ